MVLSTLALFSSCTGNEVPNRWEPLAPIPPLDQLDDWIAAREVQVEGLKPGVAVGIVWAHPEHQKTPVALIYLPGYTATRGEIYPVPDRIAEALGANLYYARPSAQGALPDAHKAVTADDWLRDAAEAYQIGLRLGEQVVVVATSTGATAAIWLTLGPAQWRPAASLFVSPNLTPRNKASELLLWPGREWLLSLLLGEQTNLEPQNDLQARYWDIHHHSHSLIPMMELVSLARRQDFRAWPTPVLVVYDLEDTVVDESVTVKLFSKAPEEVRSFLPWTTTEGDHSHVLAGDALSPGGTDRMVDAGVSFLKKALRIP